MEIRKELIQKYLHEMAIEQIKETYTAKGYIVSRETKIDNYTPDLVVSNSEETIVFEVKTKRMNDLERERFHKFSEEIRSKVNWKFKIIIAKPPKEKTLEIYNLDTLLDSFLSHIPEIVALSSHCKRYSIDEVADIEIDSLIIENGEIKTEGFGSVGVYLFYDSKDEGLYDRVYLPLNFNTVLSYENGELRINDMISWDIDTSSLN